MAVFIPGKVSNHLAKASLRAYRGDIPSRTAPSQGFANRCSYIASIQYQGYPWLSVVQLTDKRTGQA